ncbi:unnamed protein product [Sphagnum balticum]
MRASATRSTNPDGWLLIRLRCVHDTRLLPIHLRAKMRLVVTLVLSTTSIRVLFGANTLDRQGMGGRSGRALCMRVRRLFICAHPLSVTLNYTVMCML